MLSTIGMWILLAVVAIAATGTYAADCPCGYSDPSTGALWTDAILTYFNETEAGGSIVTQPTISPYIDGQKGAGNTGNGLQDWAIVGDQLDDWEDAFGATYRSGVSYNNTALQNSQLDMTVQPAEPQNRIVYGAEFVTRRRDILHGSFRAAMNATHAYYAGTVFQMSATYNISETIDLGLFTANANNASTLQWSFSATGSDANPVSIPFASLLGSSLDGFLEHRFDWTPSSIVYGNNNTNSSASSHLVTKSDSQTIPSMPVPLSFRHWSNGDPTSSEGPPLSQPQVAQVRYVRFFFNSSLPSREQEFSTQCAASQVAACNTEDLTLRGSTTFSQLSTLAVPPYKNNRQAPKYSIIMLTVSAGFIIFLIAHGLVRKLVNRKVSSSRPLASLPAEDHGELPSPSQEVRFFPQQHQRSFMTPSSSEEGKSFDDGDIEKIQDDSFNYTTPRNVLAKWDAAALTRSQVQRDSDEDDEEREFDDEDDEDDDDDLLEDAQQEIEISNDDGLGRPDHVQFAAHPHTEATPDSLPRHRMQPYPSGVSPFMPHNPYSGGYMTPARVSQPSLLLHQSEDETSSSHGRQTPSAWYNGVHSRRRSSGLGFFAPGSPFAQLHQELLSESGHSGDLKDVDLATQTPDSVLHTDSSRGSSFDSVRKPVTSRNQHGMRRPSLASLNSIAMLNAAGQSLPVADGMTSISVWTRLDKEGNEPGETLAARIDQGKKENPEATQTPMKTSWWKSIFQYLFVLDGAAAKTASGAARVSYLEGLRGFACLLVSLNHFLLMFWFAATTEDAPQHTNRFELYFYRIISPMLFNQGTKIGIFFVLPARVMGTRYMLKGKLQDLADSTLRRVPRLAFPTFAAVLINYFFIQVNAYQWVPRLASRTWSTWAYFQDYDSVGSFINAWIGLWFTVPPQSPVLLSTYATGVLWTIPVITQSSFAILITVIISRELPNAYKRYGFYFFCMLLSWYANRFDYYFIAGLVLADMDNRLHYREAAARGIPFVPTRIGERLPKFLGKGRVHGQIIGWILFLGGTLIQYLNFLDLPGGQFNDWEYGILPDLSTSEPRAWLSRTPPAVTYYDPRFSLFCMVIGIFLLCDLCSTFAGFFMLRWWAAIGRNGFSLYLLHGAVFWTWGAWLCLHLLKIGTPYWAAVTITFATSYLLLAVVCELFTRTFDAWGVSISKALWRYSSGGLGRRL